MEQLTDGWELFCHKSWGIKGGGKLSETIAEISGLSEQTREFRKGVALCGGIAARSDVMKEKLKIF